MSIHVRQVIYRESLDLVRFGKTIQATETKREGASGTYDGLTVEETLDRVRAWLEGREWKRPE